MIPGDVGILNVDTVDKIRLEHLDPDLLNIVIFGPGSGEAILIGFPDGTYAVVDGCREPSSGSTGRIDPVRELLTEIKDSGELNLAFVCLTHPHQDHYRGLGRLLSKFGEHVHQIVYTGIDARNVKRLAELEEARGKAGEALPDDLRFDGLREFFDVADRLAQDDDWLTTGLRMQKPPLHTCAAQGGKQCHVSICAPHPNDILKSQRELATIFDEPGSKIRYNANMLSGVLLITWGESQILLAGDLECSKGHGEYRGWEKAEGILDHFLDDGEVQVVNVAHHASEGAHLKSVWDRLGAKLAIVTPFKNASNSNPPRPDQINELAKSAAVAITSPPFWKEGDDQHNLKGLYNETIPRKPEDPGADPGLENSSVSRNDETCAVAVSLDHKGNIVEVFLAGAADIYEPT